MGATMLQGFIVTVYCAVASAFAVMTFLEGWMYRDGWTLTRMAGLFGSAVWPLLLALFFCHALVWRAFATSPAVVLCESRPARAGRPSHKA